MGEVDCQHELRGACIVHVDLDCFYAQVEINRLGLDPDQPAAVQQWGSLIAVNYPARSFGVSRMVRADEARTLCPEITLVHVETIDETGESRPQAKRSSDKVSLERYRAASADIFDVFVRMVGESRVEKGGLDEAFLDLTELVDAALDAAEGRSDPASGGDPADAVRGAAVAVEAALAQHEAQAPFPADDAERAWRVEGGALQPRAHENDLRMLLAARIARKVREGVYSALRYRCSAGVAGNKTLSKLASPLNKPNGLAIIPRRAVPALMRALPLKSLRFLGGKLGRKLAEDGLCTAGELQALSEAELCRRYGAKAGAWLFRLCRGVDNDPIKARTVPKTMLACKSFAPCAPGPALQRWLRVLVCELAERMARDRAQYLRVPRTLALSFSCNAGYRARSRSCPVPPACSVDAVTHAATQLLERAVEELRVAAPAGVLQFTRLQLAAASFTDAPRAGRAAITSFFDRGGGAGGSQACDRVGDGGDGGGDGGGAAEPPPARDRSAITAEPERSGSRRKRPPRGIQHFLAGAARARPPVAGDGGAASADAGGSGPTVASEGVAAEPRPPASVGGAGRAVAAAAAPPPPPSVVATPCPVCGSALRGSEAAVTRHVNMCLEGGPRSKRRKGQPSVAALLRARPAAPQTSPG